LRNTREQVITATVAAGFATLGKNSSNCGNFGMVMRKIAVGTDGKEGLATYEGHFRRLLSADSPQELCSFLPGIIRAAERKGVPIDFFRLAVDLHYWGDNKKIEWAADYWQSASESEQNISYTEQAADAEV
jgi:CRISPR type I-E-associated protein CasB/Cse2